MTNVSRWPKSTWVLVRWSGDVATWTLITAADPALAGLWWFVGLFVFGSLWLATKPLFRHGGWRDAE
jgi:hypothetical protein